MRSRLKKWRRNHIVRGELMWADLRKAWKLRKPRETEEERKHRRRWRTLMVITGLGERTEPDPMGD